VRNRHGYRRKWVSAPKVIHNRAIYKKPANQQKIEELIRGGTVIYNQQNRYDKLEIYEILMRNESLRPHLPCTVLANQASLEQMMDMFDCLIIKPSNSSIGRGIMKLERRSGRWVLTYPSSKTSSVWKELGFEKNAAAWLAHKFRQESYVIQQTLPLATYSDRPFDLRISVQRNETGLWQVTGMAGKVAAKGKFVTNVAQGGKVYTLDHLLSAMPDADGDQVK